MLRTRFSAIALSAVLATSLCPSPALAAPLAGGSISADGSGATAELNAQAKKKVWVIASVDYNYSEAASSTSASKLYAYNAKGLLANTVQSIKYKNKNSNATVSSYTHTTKQALKYQGNNLKKVTQTYKSTASKTDIAPTVYTFESKKTLPLKVTYKYSSGETSMKNVYKYTFDESNKVTSFTNDYYTNRNSDNTYSRKLKKRSTTEYTYSQYKSGHPAKMEFSYIPIEGESSDSSIVKYKYDVRGNLIRSKVGSFKPTKYQYTYKGSRVITCKDIGSSLKRNYTWKQISVPAARVAQVKAQQWSIVNNNLNHAFGPIGMGL